MELRSFRWRSLPILSLVLVCVVILEEVVMYKVRQHVHDPWLRAATALFLYGVGFALAATRLIPWLRKLIQRAHRSSRRQAGDLGLLAFYVAMFALVYLGVWLLENRGARALLPPTWR